MNRKKTQKNNKKIEIIINVLKIDQSIIDNDLQKICG